MNLPQRVVFGLGTIVIAGMVLFPPWLFVYDPPEGYILHKTTRPAGYHSLFAQNRALDQTVLSEFFDIPNVQQVASPRYFSMIIDRDRLGVQLGGILAITLLLTLLLKSKN